MTTRTDPRVAHTRQIVLGVVAQILAESGFERLTVEEVAERSGVARSTIYRNWPDRAELLVEGFDLLCSFPEPPDTGDLITDLRDFASQLISGFNNEAWGSALPSLIGAVAHDPELRAAQLRFSQTRRELVATIFRRGVERGEIRGEPDELAERFVAPFFFRHLVSGAPLDEPFLVRQLELIGHDGHIGHIAT